MQRITRIQNLFKEKTAGTDWGLLLFLLLFLNVKMLVKLVGFVWILLYGYSRKRKIIPKIQGPVMFYAGMIAIGVLNFFVWQLYTKPHYPLLLLVGAGCWLMSLLVYGQLQQVVQHTALEKIHRTLLLFFILNAAVSFGQLFLIMLETGEWNPYRYQGNYQKYFISTGDYIRGISFDTSTTNALLNAFAVVYFLLRKQMGFALFCMAALLLTCSNFTNLLILLCLLVLFVWRSNRNQRSVIMAAIMMLVLFMVKISPQNNSYVLALTEKSIGRSDTSRPKPNLAPVPLTQQPDSILSPEEKKKKKIMQWLDSMEAVKQLSMHQQERNHIKDTLRPLVPKVNIHAPEYQHRPDTSAARLQAMNYLQNLQQQGHVQLISDTPTRRKLVPGKLIAYRQLAKYMQQHPAKMITGAGMGNFSSKLAFRATGLQIAGGYPASLRYVNPDFETNHLEVYLLFFGKDSGYHSMAHSPNSFYGQLLGEYGLFGVLLFVLVYVRWCVQKWRNLSYAIPLLFLMAGALATEYWFEQLSIVIVFELMLLLNRKETGFSIKGGEHA